jgi:hypothetical protein
MNLFPAILFGLVPIVMLTALLIGLPSLVKRRNLRRAGRRPAQHAQLALASPTSDRTAAPLAMHLELTTVLVDSGQVLVGYRTREASAAGYRSFTDVSPTATGTLLLSLGRNERPALATLDRWSHEGIELALRAPDDSDVVVLYDRRTAQQLVLSQIRAP